MIRIKSEVLRRRKERRFRSQTDRAHRRHILELFLLFCLLILVNVGAMMVLEGHRLEDALWLTLTTVTTVGYGDIAPATAAGRVAVVLLLYGFGIFLLAQIFGEWIDYRLHRRERMKKGMWRWHMKNHIVVLNTPEAYGDRYLRLLVEQIRDTPTLKDAPIQVVSPNFPDGLPHDIENLDVVLKAGKPEGWDHIEEVDIDEARCIILLAVDTNDPSSDSINLDMLDRLHSHNLKGQVVAECVLEGNRERFKRKGATAVIRPIRAYPELLVRTLAAPGTEAIIEDLFVYAGSHPRRYDMAFENQQWGEMACRLLMQGLGTPLGYLDGDGKMVTNPPPDARVTGKALFVMVSQDEPYKPDQVASCVQP